jgi:hypothetical protein
MSNFISTTSVSAPTIVICLGQNQFGTFRIEVTESGYMSAGFDTLTHADWLEGGHSPVLSALVELIDAGDSVLGLLPNAYPIKKSPVEMVAATGDIEKPEAKVWNYSRNILTLAKDKKREEVTNSTDTLYGIELEFNHSNHSLMDLYPLLGMGIFKSDSTVDGEYVTLPYTYDQMVTKIKELADSFNKLLSANNTLTETSGVGMHVHVSRRSLPDNVWVSLVEWICEHRKLVEALAGRKGNRWCAYKYGASNDRYVAVNMCNSQTVEFRMFLSPHDADGVLRNLATVKAWVDHAQTLPPSYGHLVEYNGYEITVVGDAPEAGYGVAEPIPYFMQRSHGRPRRHMVVGRNVGEWAAPVRLPYYMEDGALIVETHNHRSNIRAGRIEESLFGWENALEIELHSPQGWEAFDDYDPDSEPGADDYGDMDGDEDNLPTSEWLFY